jgi:hypothetical protein
MIEQLLTAANLNSAVIVMLALFAKDFVVGILRAVSKKLLSDKDKKNDAIGVTAGVIADSLEKVKK